MDTPNSSKPAATETIEHIQEEVDMEKLQEALQTIATYAMNASHPEGRTEVNSLVRTSSPTSYIQAVGRYFAREYIAREGNTAQRGALWQVLQNMQDLLAIIEAHASDPVRTPLGSVTIIDKQTGQVLLDHGYAEREGNTVLYQHTEPLGGVAESITYMRSHNLATVEIIPDQEDNNG